MYLSDHYTHCPLCGSTDFKRLSDHQRVCTDCGHKDFNSPVTAVGALVLADDGKMLWIRRGRDPGKGLLGLPGGFVDAGESLEQALCREVLEETGLKVNNLRYLCSFPNNYVYQNITRPVCDAFFLAHCDSRETIPQAGEVSECLWRKPESIREDELAFDSMRKALRHYLKP